MKVACILAAVVVLMHQAIASEADVQQVMRMLMQPRELERWQQHSDPALNSFSWSNCGASSDPIQIKNLTLSPDPVKLPGNLTVSFGAELGVALSAPVELDLKIKKKIGIWIEIPCLEGIGSCDYTDMCQLLHNNVTCPPDFAKYNIPCDCPIKQLSLELKKKIGVWVKIPCVDNVGSCDYPDVCQMLANVTCPPEFAKYHIPCRCPIAQGSYYLPGATFYVTLPSTIPSWLDDGDYEVQATLKAAGKELGCFKVNLSITK